MEKGNKTGQHRNLIIEPTQAEKKEHVQSWYVTHIDRIQSLTTRLIAHSIQH